MKSKALLLVVAVAGLAALLIPVVARRPEPAPPPPAKAPAASPESTPSAVPAPASPPAPVPIDPLREWTAAIRRRNERGVLQAQSVFLAKEGEYREPLMKLAAEDADPRVRSFSVAVLGRMKEPPPESFFIGRLGDAHEYPRTSALQALEKRGSGACLPKVDELAGSDAAPAVRAAAAATAKAVRSR
jgi:hypothetical protein